MSPPEPWVLVLSCEHGGNAVPPAYQALFAGHDELLESHRGWDPGTLELGTLLRDRLGVPLVATTVTRLLIDNNRSLGHRALFSELSRGLGKSEKEQVVETWYTPHRSRVEDAVRAVLDNGACVVHVGLHSFTPVLGDEPRLFDIGWLYDSRRSRERQWVDAAVARLKARRADLRQRRNAPYLGRADGLTTSLRRRFPEERYLGIELEVNQLHPLGPRTPWVRLMEDLIAVFLPGPRGEAPAPGRCRSFGRPSREVSGLEAIGEEGQLT